MPKSNHFDGLKLSRRQSLKVSASAAAAGIMASGQVAAPVLAQAASPTTTPFVTPLPVYMPKQPVTSLVPAPQQYYTDGECGRRPHQDWTKWPAEKYYNLYVREAWHSFHPELPTQTIWGFDGITPGPTFVAHYGEPIIVRIHNQLPPNTVGYGSPEITTHLHNLHTPSESDGFPGDYFSTTKYGPGMTEPGSFRDHHYVNVCAGYDQYPDTNGDPREALGTLWYHDHRMDFTAANVYRGLVGMYLLFDDIDSGNELDPNPYALRLPSGVGVYDIPLVFHDKAFDSSGYAVFNQFETDGFLGNKFLVNGKIQPYFNVARRKYRFRMLDASQSRFYEFFLVYNNSDQNFLHIANDGNLLPAPINTKSLRIAPAERGDIVIDFSKYPIGSQLFLVNRLSQISGRGPAGLVSPGTQILRFDVSREAPARDYSRVPSTLRVLPPINYAKVVKQRTFRFERENEVWVVNGRIFDPDTPMVKVKLGTAEIWTLQGKGAWHHPVHIHFEEGRILSRNGLPPAPHERGRKDVYVLAPGDELRIYLQFRDMVGRYVTHCHNTVHEDHAMMMRWDIEP